MNIFVFPLVHEEKEEEEERNNIRQQNTWTTKHSFPQTNLVFTLTL
jgi:hypothetical protein